MYENIKIRIYINRQGGGSVLGKTTKKIVSTRGLTSVMGNPSVRHRRRLVETSRWTER